MICYWFYTNLMTDEQMTNEQMTDEQMTDEL